MQIVTFNNTELHLVEHPRHEFLLSNKEVALGYGTSLKALSLTKARNADELIEGKHWLRLEVQTKGGKQKVIHWTKRGIVRLGFFIKSQQAKQFRDWAEDHIVNEKATPTQLDMITPYEVRRDLATTRRLLTIEKKKHRATAEYYEKKLKALEDVKPLIEEHWNYQNENAKLRRENAELKRVLIDIKDRYHKIVKKADDQIQAMKKELVVMTNLFQTIPNLANDGKNLNADTLSKHLYWN